MNKKLYDIEVPLGSYTDKQGNEKTRWQNVGAMFEGEKGPYLLLDRWFNPAGLPNPENKTSVVLNLYEPRNKR
ncbi:MAG: hypothetical protein QM504_12165 [Pseudomonadota bacterium]